MDLKSLFSLIGLLEALSKEDVTLETLGSQWGSGISVSGWLKGLFPAAARMVGVFLSIRL